MPNMTTISRPTAIFAIVLAGTIHAIQRYCPGDQVTFVGVSGAAFLLAFAAVGDPATFFQHFPFLLWIVPSHWADHVHKSIDYLEEGRRRRDSDAVVVGARKVDDDNKNILSSQLHATQPSQSTLWWGAAANKYR